MKNILSVIIALFLSATAFSQETKQNITEASFTVHGICDMCKQRIEKAAMYSKGVKKANWDADKQLLTVIYRNDKTSQHDIEEAISEAGYDTENLVGADKPYNALPTCCKYRRITPH